MLVVDRTEPATIVVLKIRSGVTDFYRTVVVPLPLKPGYMTDIYRTAITIVENEFTEDGCVNSSVIVNSIAVLENANVAVLKEVDPGVEKAAQSESESEKD